MLKIIKIIFSLNIIFDIIIQNDNYYIIELKEERVVMETLRFNSASIHF